MKIEKLYRILLIRFLFVLTIIFFQFADGQTIENVLTSTNLDFALDNFQEKEIVRLSVPEGITTVEVEITLPLGIEYAEGTTIITKGEAKIIQKAGTLLSQPTFVVTINKSNTITFEFNRKVTSQALLLKGELKDTVKLKVGERLYDTKLSNSYYLRSPSLLLQPSPIVFDKKDGEHNDFFVLSNMGIGGVKDIYFSVDYPEEVSLIDLKYKGEKILPIGVVPAGYANAGAPLYRVEGTFFKGKKDRIIIYEHYTVTNCQANCPIKYAAYWGDNILHFYETKEVTKLLHPKKEPTVITLSDDTYTVTTTESTTTTATTVGSVFTNDRMNGKHIDIQKVIFSLLPQSTPTSFVITKDGNIIVPSHTPIGRYTLNYRICDNSQPSKDKSLKPICQTATVTIVVLQSVTTPTTTTSTTVTATTTPTIVTPTIITLSDDTYTLTTTESTTTTITTVGSVFSNDRMNGKPIDIRKVIFSLLPQSTPNTFIITKEGNIIVPAQTPAGRYTLNYCICDNSQPLKNKNHKPVCQTATVTIVVLQSVTTPTTTSTTVTATTTPTVVTPTIITLSDDTYTLTTTESTTTTATTVGSVFTNDRLNGKPINIQKVIFSLLPQSTPTYFVITKDGNIIVPPQTPIGRYTLNYRICDNSQTSKGKSLKSVCQTATVTIAVLQSVTTPTTTTSTTITTTTTPTVITLSDDTYTLTTTASTTTTATTVGSVFANDRLNGKPIDIQKVIFSLLPQSTPTSFVITKDGNIIVPSHTPIGHYILNYRICDNSQPLKNKSLKPICKTATVTIVILQSVTTPTTTTSTTITTTTTPTIATPTIITLSDDTYTITTTESTTTTATTIGSVLSNDRLNGKPIDIQKVIFSLLPQSTPISFVITKDGNIIVPPQTPIGRYTLNYRICLKDKNFKPICQTATVTIVVLQSVTTTTTTTSTTITATTTPTVVSPTVITLSDDTYTLTTTESTTTTATTVGSVFTNDRLNGKPIDIQKVIFSLLPQSTPISFVITKDGNIIVPPQTPIGRYTLNYRICLKDKNFKPICQTVTVTIAVLQSVTTPTTTTSTTVTATTITPTVIILSDDTYTITTTKSTTTTATTVGSVFTNDHINGKPIDIQKVIFSLLPQSTPNTFIITKNGNIIVPSQTPIGRYTLNYRICDNSQTSKDKNHKPVCQTATVTIAVLQSVTTPTITTPTTVTNTTASTTVTATTTATVVTPTVITLSDDTYTVTTTASTTTTATTVGSVFANDRLNGKPIDIQKVIFSLLPQSTPNTFVITKDGNIIVPPHTPIGRYILNYRICDNSQTLKNKNQKPVCQTATVTIAVLQTVTTLTNTTSTTVTTTTPTVITLSDDTYTLTTTESTTTTATTVGSVFSNDSMNGNPIDIQKVIFSLLPQSTSTSFVITKGGNIIVPAHTPIGRYTLNYRICDNSQTLKNKQHKPICQTAIVTIAVLQLVTTPTNTTSTTVTATITATVVTPTIITLSDDTYTVTTTESTTTTATTVGSVFSNDRMNGKPIDIQKVIFSLLPQSTLNTFVITKAGNIIVPAQTPMGRYTLNYRICDNSQTSKDNSLKPICQTATVTIAILQSVTTPTTATSTTVTTTTTPTIVTPTTITLSDDTYTLTTTESTTTTATTVGSVFNNDRMNGKPIDIQKVIFSLLPQSTPNTFIITKDGNIIVPAQTPIGRYTLNYRICDNSSTLKDKNFKPICQTATVTIVVRQTVTTPTTTTSTTVTATTTPTVITLSDDTYTITTTASTTTTATTVGSVFTNDRINGKPIDIQKVIFSLLPQSTPNTFIITKDGNIIVPPQTPIGRYTLNYRICDNSQPLKNKTQKLVCQTATVTITILQSVTTPTTATSTTITATTTPTVVTPTILTLSDDTYTVTTTESATTTATTVGSVFSNDRLNGKPIDIQKVIFSLLPQSTPNTFVITKEGNIIVPPHTPIGRYTLNYRICDNSQTSKDKSLKTVCQTATLTIAVLQLVTTPTTATSTTVTATTTPTVVTPTILTLSDDTYTVTTTESATTTATTVGSVLSNDRLNGKPIDIQKVIFSLLPQSTSISFVITKEGNIIVPSQTPIGRYTLNYRICDNSQTLKDKNHKPICQTATVTIAILQSVTTPTVITLSDDTYTLTTTASTTTTATTVGCVFSNDRMNGKPIDIQKVIFSLLPQSTPNTFIITKDGNIIIPSQTPIGRYTLNYRICDNSQPLKNKNHKPVCQTATVTIAVLQLVTTPTTTTSTTFTTTTTATVITPTVITPTVITLSDDTYTITTTEGTTTTATTVGSVFTNDRLNGKPIDIQKVIFSLLPQSTPNTFIITKDGNIIVPPQTPIGRYTLNYRICDNSQILKDKSLKPICKTATVTIVILQSVTTPTTSTTITATTTTPTVITLLDDTYTVTTTESTTTTATTVGSVFTNDRLNGKPIDIQKVIFSLLPQSTPTSFIITKDGNIIVPSHTPIGRYTLNYSICDSKNKNQKPICQTATITITILQTPVTPTVSATVETDTSSTTQSATNQPIAVPDSVTTPMNTPIRIAVLDNDTPYTASPKIIVFPTNGDAFVKEDNTILYRPRVRFIGTDYFVYELCTPSSQSCTTATVTVKVTHKVVADNAMSANGDDKNDYFHIVGIENYPDNQVTIYNRNGEKVFTISHYNNRQRVFKGIVEGEVSLSNTAYLPQDTYFYLIEYYDENRQLQRQIGWLYLKR